LKKQVKAFKLSTKVGKKKDSSMPHFKVEKAKIEKMDMKAKIIVKVAKQKAKAMIN